MSINVEEDIKFIVEDLLPEMVCDRCFCDAGSREFVEFHSAKVDPKPFKTEVPFRELICYSYSADLTVNFSGMPTNFSIIIKLAPKAIEFTDSFCYFLTEEYFYTKMLKKYNKDLFPKCYLSTLGKYGRPVIVLENLLNNGFRQVETLNSEELKLCLQQIAQFHATGLKLKKEELEILREFENNIYKASFLEEESQQINDLISKKLYATLGSKNQKLIEQLKQVSSDDKSFVNILQDFNSRRDHRYNTICHGNLQCLNIHFKYENGKAVEVKFQNLELMKISSLGLHLMTFLILNNIILNNDAAEIIKHSHLYLEELKLTHPEISEEDLNYEINEALLPSYINCVILKL